jgi:hypothetical protein
MGLSVELLLLCVVAVANKAGPCATVPPTPQPTDMIRGIPVCEQVSVSGSQVDEGPIHFRGKTGLAGIYMLHNGERAAHVHDRPLPNAGSSAGAADRKKPIYRKPETLLIENGHLEHQQVIMKTGMHQQLTCTRYFPLHCCVHMRSLRYPCLRLQSASSTSTKYISRCGATLNIEFNAALNELFSFAVGDYSPPGERRWRLGTF